jgi:hypothetical protein
MRGDERVARMTALVVALAISLSGCSGGATVQEKPTGPTAADGLANLRDLFRQAAAGKVAVPKSAADFAAVEPLYPVAGPFVLSGAISCAWGAALASGGDAATQVLAWEKAAATDGGWVMFQDGTIRQVTADEFKAAAKAAP